jgi:glycine/serine hydroxymethyltransferase
VNQEKFAREVLKKFKMSDCARVNTLVECGVKMSKNAEGEKINSTTFKSLVGSLRYLICTRLNILFGVELVNKFTGTLIMTHQNIEANSSTYQRYCSFWLVLWIF